MFSVYSVCLCVQYMCMCIFMYIYIYINIYTYICFASRSICVCTYIRTYVCVYSRFCAHIIEYECTHLKWKSHKCVSCQHTNLDANPNTHLCSYLYANKITHIYLHITSQPMRTHTFMFTHTHSHLRTCIYIPTYT
jgi:hypothetical protein